MPKKRKSRAGIYSDKIDDKIDSVTMAIEQGTEEAIELIENIISINQDDKDKIMPRVLAVIHQLTDISIDLETRAFSEVRASSADLPELSDPKSKPSIPEVQILLALFTATETIYSALRDLPTVNLELTGDHGPYQNAAEKLDDYLILSLLDPKDIPSDIKNYMQRSSIHRNPLLTDLRMVVVQMKDMVVNQYPGLIDAAMQASATKVVQPEITQRKKSPRAP